jgi:hypothetical protein
MERVPALIAWGLIGVAVGAIFVGTIMLKGREA